MKKFLAVVLGLAFAMSASAMDLNLHVTHAGSVGSGVESNSLGIGVGQYVLPNVHLEADLDRSNTRGVNQTRVEGKVGYDVLHYGNMVVRPELGAAYLFNTNAANGFALTAGATADFALNQHSAIFVNYEYQDGQNRVSQFNGNRISVGYRYTF